MPGSSFGEVFRVTTAGESHGPGNVVIVDGCPAGLPLAVEDLIPDLERRRPGQVRARERPSGERAAAGGTGFGSGGCGGSRQPTADVACGWASRCV